MFIICTAASRYKQREYDFYPRTERLRRRDNVLQRVKDVKKSGSLSRLTARATRSRRLYKLALSKDIEKKIFT